MDSSNLYSFLAEFFDPSSPVDPMQRLQHLNPVDCDAVMSRLNTLVSNLAKEGPASATAKLMPPNASTLQMGGPNAMPNRGTQGRFGTSTWDCIWGGCGVCTGGTQERFIFPIRSGQGGFR